jgi:adenylate kinase
MSSKGPVIVITGTPGTGKSTHAQILAQESPVPLRHINVGDLVKEKNLYEEYDSEWQSHIVDEDRVRNMLSPGFNRIEISIASGRARTYHRGR